MTDDNFDKLFDELFGDDVDEIDAELDRLDAEERRAGEEDDDFEFEDTEVGGSHQAHCPYCGEPVDIFVDPAGGASQDYVEDCSVCCQPMTVQVRLEVGGQFHVQVDTAQ